jgi:hypothetical protein
MLSTRVNYLLIIHLVTDSAAVFDTTDTCKLLSRTEIESLGKAVTGIMSGFQRGFSKSTGNKAKPDF